MSQIKVIQNYAICDTNHQIIMYKWNEKNFWKCPVCDVDDDNETMQGNPITHLTEKQAMAYIRNCK